MLYCEFIDNINVAGLWWVLVSSGRGVSELFPIKHCAGVHCFCLLPTDNSPWKEFKDDPNGQLNTPNVFTLFFTLFFPFTFSLISLILSMSYVNFMSCLSQVWTKVKKMLWEVMGSWDQEPHVHRWFKDVSNYGKYGYL